MKRRDFLKSFGMLLAVPFLPLAALVCKEPTPCFGHIESFQMYESQNEIWNNAGKHRPYSEEDLVRLVDGMEKRMNPPAVIQKDGKYGLLRF